MAAAVLTVALSLAPAAADECAPGLVHSMPLCLTVEQFEAMWNPPPPPAPIVAGVEQWRPMVEYYWDEPHTSRMLRIMWCESRGLPWAWNKSTDVRGLFQIRWPLWSKVWGGDYFDPWINAATAYQIWLSQGYRAWACKG